MKLDQLLASLSRLKKTGPYDWQACCPAHEDKSPSLVIRRTEDTILLHCFGGCSTDEVLGAVGMTFSDLYPETKEHRIRPQRFNPREVLEAVRAHTMFVGACAMTMRERPLTDDERQKLFKSAELLQFAASSGGV